MKHQPLIFCLIALLIASCSRHKVSVSNDFEHFDGWIENSTLSKGSGHSGSYFSRTDSLREYSFTYSKQIKYISEKHVRRIDYGAWVRLPDTSAVVRLVLSLEANGKTEFYEGIASNTAHPQPNEWVRLFMSSYMPETYSPDAVLKVYLWNTSKKIADADDIDIRFYTE